MLMPFNTIVVRYTANKQKEDVMPTSSGRGSGHSPANVTKNLKGIDFPADKQDLLKHAQHLHAEKVVIDEIQKMDDREYNSMADVMKSFGQEHEGSSSSSSRSSQKGQQGQQQAGQGKSSGGRSSHK
jgi:hypothetical protein